MLILTKIKGKWVAVLFWVLLGASFVMGFCKHREPEPYEPLGIAQLQRFLNDKGYPCVIDGKLTVNGDGETEGAWNALIADRSKK